MPPTPKTPSAPPKTFSVACTRLRAAELEGGSLEEVVLPAKAKLKFDLSKVEPVADLLLSEKVVLRWKLCDISTISSHSSGEMHLKLTLANDQEIVDRRKSLGDLVETAMLDQLERIGRRRGEKCVFMQMDHAERALKLLREKKDSPEPGRLDRISLQGDSGEGAAAAAGGSPVAAHPDSVKEWMRAVVRIGVVLPAASLPPRDNSVRDGARCFHPIGSGFLLQGKHGLVFTCEHVRATCQSSLEAYPEGRVALCPTSGWEADWSNARVGIVLAHTKHWDPAVYGTSREPRPDRDAVRTIDAFADAAVFGVCKRVPATLAAASPASTVASAETLQAEGWGPALPLS